MTDAPPPQHTRLPRWILLLMLLPIVYLGTYVVLSAAGRYESGPVLLFANSKDWMPWGLGYDHLLGDGMTGPLSRFAYRCFTPCLAVDRAWIHRPRITTSAEMLEPPTPSPAPP